MQPIRGAVQHYDWGDREFLPRLLGTEPDGRPWAELWLGTHRRGPAFLDDGRPLSDVTGELPFLLKLLAAERPLSLQTHPNAAQAADGFRRGVFADPFPKPELLCALTTFHALCGVRPAGPTCELLDALGLGVLAARVRDEGPDAVIVGLLTGSIDPQPIVDACSRSTAPEAIWVTTLAGLHPRDPSVAASILLNLVVLEPGRALHLGAGNLHAYLHGAGIELMGPSDNVLRAGLTTKSVDVDELVRVADLSPLERPVLDEADRYRLPEVGASLCRLEPGARHRAGDHEIAVELAGATWYLAPGDEYAPSGVAYVVTG